MCNTYGNEIGLYEYLYSKVSVDLKEDVITIRRKQEQVILVFMRALA